MTVPPPVVPCQCCGSTRPTVQSSLVPHHHLCVMVRMQHNSKSKQKNLEDGLAPKTNLAEELLQQDLVLQVGQSRVELR